MFTKKFDLMSLSKCFCLLFSPDFEAVEREQFVRFRSFYCFQPETEQYNILGSHPEPDIRGKMYIVYCNK